MDKERAENYFKWTKHFEGTKLECKLYCENERNKEMLNKTTELLKSVVEWNDTVGTKIPSHITDEIKELLED